MIELNHIGEKLLAEMFNRSADVRWMILNRMRLSEIGDSEIFAADEVPLSPCGGVRFDGAHKIDVALISNISMCVAIEAKLGTTGLGKKTFERKFLSPCETSHEGTAIKGSMISILEGKLPEVCEGETLSINYNGSKLPLRAGWLLVTRQSVIDAWRRDEMPSLSENCTILSFESIADAYGGREPFNSLVSELVQGDYYQLWLG